jgi:glycosyltransferase involved in cell wall biosynthesis
MRVSVALCTYNGAAHLAAQLDSLAQQARLPDELVVSDDGSTDDTLDIVRDFAAAAPFPVHIHRPPGSANLTLNFQHALSQCTGDVLLPCDQDDRWHPTKIASQLAPFHDSAVHFSIVNSSICDTNLASQQRTVFDEQRFGPRYQTLLRTGQGYRAYLRHLIAPGHAMAFRRSVLEVAFPIPTTCLYDQWLALCASMLGKTALIDESLVDYRTHRGQVTGGERKTLTDWAAAQKTLKLDHLQRSFDTHAVLRDRLESVSLPAEKLALLDAKLRFLGSRLTLRRGRVTRTLVSLQLLVGGQYHRLGRGWLTFLRDVRG